MMGAKQGYDYHHCRCKKCKQAKRKYDKYRRDLLRKNKVCTFAELKGIEY